MAVDKLSVYIRPNGDYSTSHAIDNGDWVEILAPSSAACLVKFAVAVTADPNTTPFSNGVYTLSAGSTVKFQPQVSNQYVDFFVGSVSGSPTAGLNSSPHTVKVGSSGLD